jgi:glycosyltransferase involved in cell wall biosynthesis
VIALTGSATHERDWLVTRDVFSELASRDDVKIIVMGYHPEYLSDIKEIDFLPPLPYAQYAQVIRQSDIVLAPVDPDDKFNLGKSPIKVVEAMGARRMGKYGAVAVATGNEIYASAISHGRNGFLIREHHNPREWVDVICSAIDNPELFKRVGEAALKSAYKRYDMSKEWKRWGKAYRQILSSPPNRVRIHAPRSNIK